MNFAVRIQKSKSGFGISASIIPCVPNFSQNGKPEAFWRKFREIAHLHAYFCSNTVEGVSESWVEAEMSWVEVGVCGWTLK